MLLSCCMLILSHYTTSNWDPPFWTIGSCCCCCCCCCCCVTTTFNNCVAPIYLTTVINCMSICVQYLWVNNVIGVATPLPWLVELRKRTLSLPVAGDSEAVTWSNLRYNQHPAIHHRQIPLRVSLFIFPADCLLSFVKTEWERNTSSQTSSWPHHSKRGNMGNS